MKSAFKSVGYRVRNIRWARLKSDGKPYQVGDVKLRNPSSTAFVFRYESQWVRVDKDAFHLSRW
jgi:hypothetical protein